MQVDGLIRQAVNKNPGFVCLSPQCCPVCRAEVDHVQQVYLPTCASLLNLALPNKHTSYRIPRALPTHRGAAMDYTDNEKIC